jgi:DnaJ domain
MNPPDISSNSKAALVPARAESQGLVKRGLHDLSASEHIKTVLTPSEDFYVVRTGTGWRIMEDSEVRWEPEVLPDGTVLLRIPEMLCGLLRGAFFSKSEAEKFAEEKNRGDHNQVVKKLPKLVPHVWTGPDDVAHGFPPGCSFCGESDSAQYGKPCPKRSCYTWYEVLDVPKRADQNQIESAYCELLKEWDPKRLRYKSDFSLEGGVFSENEVKWFNAAYAVLGDPVKRQQYDGELFQHRQPNPENPPEQKK